MPEDARRPSPTPPLPVVYDRRRGTEWAQGPGHDLPPGAVEPEDAVRDPGRTPVVLVHGTSGDAARDWFTLAPLLRNAGVPVFAFRWSLRAGEDGRSTTASHVDDLATFVDRVVAATGSDTVDLVGHSWGAVLARALVRRPPGDRRWTAPHLVGLAPTYAGTTLNGLSSLADHPRAKGARAWLDENLPGWREQSAGSDVLERVNDRSLDGHDAAVDYVSIVTRFDLVVTPMRAAFEAEPRAERVVVQDSCRTDLVDHVAIVHDAIALWHVMRTLAPDAAGEQPRGLVLPFVGGPASASDERPGDASAV